MGITKEPIETLFCDIDDCLIIWTDSYNPTNIWIDKWNPNSIVIDFVNKWLDIRPTGKIVYWSTGGKEYARQRVNEIRDMNIILPNGIFESKYPRIPLKEDLFIDDQSLNSFKIRTIHPSILLSVSNFNILVKEGYKCLENVL